MLTWRYATPDDYFPIRELFEDSKLGSGFHEVQRRIVAPLLLRQIITFYENSTFCGFVSFAWLKGDADDRMREHGIGMSDWRSGHIFWVIDFAMKKMGYAALRMVTKALGIKKARYFRKKHGDIREVVA